MLTCASKPDGLELAILRYWCTEYIMSLFITVQGVLTYYGFIQYGFWYSTVFNHTEYRDPCLLSLISLSTIPGIVQYKIVLNSTNFPI